MENSNIIQYLTIVITTITTATGIGIFIVPKAIRIIREIKALKKEFRKFHKKHIVEAADEMRVDLFKIIRRIDNVLELIADIFQKLQMKKAAKGLRDLIDKDDFK